MNIEKIYLSTQTILPLNLETISKEMQTGTHVSNIHIINNSMLYIIYYTLRRVQRLLPLS